MSEKTPAQLVEEKLAAGENPTAHEAQVLKLDRQQKHIARLRAKIESGHPKADVYRARLAELEGVREEIGHAEELERLRARRRMLRSGDVTVEPKVGGKGAAGVQPSVGS